MFQEKEQQEHALNQKEEHYYKGGLAEFVSYLNKNHNPIFPTPVHIKGEKEQVPVELALSYNERFIHKNKSRRQVVPIKRKGVTGDLNRRQKPIRSLFFHV